MGDNDEFGVGDLVQQFRFALGYLHVYLDRYRADCAGGESDILSSRGVEVPSIENPWTDLTSSSTGNLSARVDEGVFERHRSHRAVKNLRLDMLPVPFIGSPDADVLLLTLNPGARTADDKHGPAFVEVRRQALRFEASSTFFCLDNEFSSTEGYAYWTSRLRALAEAVGAKISPSGTEVDPETFRAVGYKVLAKRLLVLQYLGYQSLTWQPLPEIVPSQLFAFELVQRAIDSGRLVIVMRSRKLWQSAVQSLASAKVVELRNPRSPYLTPKNMGEPAFLDLVDRLSRPPAIRAE